MSDDAETDGLRERLREVFGFESFRGGQEAVMRSLLAGRSALALFPTGAGKSLCYQLPALLMEGVTLVISPLIALMKDQVEALQARGVAAARLDSTLSPSEAMEVLDALKGGRLKLLYVAPERLLKESFIERLKRVRVAMMAVDEAHCISEWGHNFRPEYLRLAHVAGELKLHPVLALTATATPSVAADVCTAFGIEARDHVQTSFLRANLRYRITPVAEGERLALLTERLRQCSGSAVVYVTLQRTAEEVATHLQRAGLAARAYHAGMPTEHRAEAQDAFMSGKARIMVATIAFGMGIDKADIRAVFHYNLPKTIENYMQETGRAGRDGEVSICEMLPCRDDCVVLENFVYGDTPTPSAVRQLVDHLLRQGEEFDVSMYDLAIATDIRPMVIETVITNLELRGMIQPLGSFYAKYQVKMLRGEDRILAGHTPARQRFLAALLASGSKARLWITIDPEQSAAAMGEPREKILKALTWLEEGGDIALKPTGVRQRYRLKAAVAETSPMQVAREMEVLFLEREKREVSRLNQVLELAMESGCLTQWLLRYFGENLEQPCGVCGRCEAAGKVVPEIPGSLVPEIRAEDVELIAGLRREGHAALRHPRQVARFLCGLTSPATTRARLTRHDAFGLLERVPFQEVLTQVESMGG